MTEIQSKQERFLALLKPHHDKLARFARAMTRTADDARDLVSDTLEQAFKHFHTLRNEAAFVCWLLTIASRLAKRRRWRERIFERLNPLMQHQKVVLEQSAASNADTLYDTQVLYDALQRLPHKHREALTLFEISGFSIREIQEIQGGSLSAVKMRLVRAREALRAMIAESLDSEHRATIHHLTQVSEHRTVSVLKKYSA